MPSDNPDVFSACSGVNVPKPTAHGISVKATLTNIQPLVITTAPSSILITPTASCKLFGCFCVLIKSINPITIIEKPSRASAILTTFHFIVINRIPTTIASNAVIRLFFISISIDKTSFLSQHTDSCNPQRVTGVAFLLIMRLLPFFRSSGRISAPLHQSQLPASV